MLDNHYIEPRLAAIYDLDSGWSIDRDFYLKLAGPQKMSVLDVGCGTGLLCVQKISGDWGGTAFDEQKSREMIFFAKASD
jgi:2-polyprenyl-3-methyl-5-hydroxy-6-metoxy-1,4-benzoquinol methylase